MTEHPGASSAGVVRLRRATDYPAAENGAWPDPPLRRLCLDRLTVDRDVEEVGFVTVALRGSNAEHEGHSIEFHLSALEALRLADWLTESGRAAGAGHPDPAM